MTPPDNGQQQPRRKISRKVFILVGIFLAWLVFDLSGFGGNIRFYAKWIECGQKPVITNPEPDFGGGSVQDYGPAPTFQLIRMAHYQYCTPLEAERAGYSASPSRYEFPHLNEAGEPNPRLR